MHTRETLGLLARVCAHTALHPRPLFNQPPPPSPTLALPVMLPLCLPIHRRRPTTLPLPARAECATPLSPRALTHSPPRTFHRVAMHPQSRDPPGCTPRGTERTRARAYIGIYVGSIRYVYVYVYTCVMYIHRMRDELEESSL